ncbi:MAG: DUF58 domain-containing protein [Candidatus Pacearchaeota archaeon]
MEALKNLNEKKKFDINFARAISEFEKAFQKFPVKRILYNMIFRGKGLEFDSYRTFEPSDDTSMIDWKATLRANETLAKKYIEERDLSIYFLVDVSNGMLFGSGEKLKAEYSAEIVASIAHLIYSSGDKIGLVMFNDGPKKILYPSNSKNQFLLFTKFLSDPKYYGGGFNLEKTIMEVLKFTKSAYTIFIVISDFINLKKEDETIIKILGSRFETMAIMIRDSLDESLDDLPFQISIQDPHSKRQMTLDPSITTKKYEESVAKQKELIRDIFKRSKTDLLELNIQEKFVPPTVKFLKGRSRGGRV